MSTTDEPQYRTYHRPDPDEVELREIDDAPDGTFVVRMPIVSTGEVRNEGDEALTREEIDGMARQIGDRSIGVFLDHGMNRDIAGSRFSAVEKVGEWESPAVDEREADDTAVVVADARMMDPATLPADTGDVREALTVLKSQVDRDMTLSSSIGWRDDESFPGDVDLMEVSLVGIPADPRTTSQDAMVDMARAASDARDGDVDAERLVERFRTVVMGPDSERENDMTDEETAGDDAGTDTETDEQQSVPDAEAFRAEMLALQREQTETLQSVAERLATDADADADTEDEQSADGDDDERAEGVLIDVGDATLTADDVRDLRDQLDDAEPETNEPDADDEQDANNEETETETATDDPYNKYGLKPT